MFGAPGEYALFADGELTPEDYVAAKKLLGRLNDSVRMGGPVTQSLKYTAADGTMYVAMVGPGTRRVIVRRTSVTSEEHEVVLTALWIPRGFVFVPGNAGTPRGWGLPVRQQEGDSDYPFGAANVAPGIDVARWTANGPGAEVLLTLDDTSKYPDASRKVLPIGYEDAEWKPDMTWQPPVGSWHIARPTFNDFSWSGKGQIARQSLWRTCATALTASLCSLPYAGFYDDAQEYASLIAQYGTNEATWQTTYTPMAVRGDKDGHRGTYNEVWGLNGTAAQLAGVLSPIGTPTQLDAGVDGGVMTLTLRDETKWIQAGNAFWHPDDAALPTLSWDSYPAQNLPNWLVTGGWVGDTGSAIFPLDQWWYEWRGQTRYVYSKNLYAMGRCIGVLPDVVIAAAIRKETVPVEGEPNETKQVNRVVVIAWRASDQFGDSNGIAYLWKFRVYCVDFDATPDVPLHVTSVPQGVYDAVTNPTGWRECGSFAASPAAGTQVPTSLPDLTIWQTWRFNGDGTAALAAFGVPPYEADWGPRWVEQIAFDAIDADVLDWSQSTVVSEPSTGSIVAADYDGAGISYVWEQTIGTPQMVGPTGESDATFGMFFWSGGGDGEVTLWAGAPDWVTSDRCVLDARDGALAILDHWYVCPGGYGRYAVRLARQGARIDTTEWADTANVAEASYQSVNYLDRLNACYARDRDGHYMFGYDLGTTVNSTLVYVSQPVCGQSYPAQTGASVSSYFGSRWLFNGQPIDFQGLPDAPMRAFPVGVC